MKAAGRSLTVPQCSLFGRASQPLRWRGRVPRAIEPKCDLKVASREEATSSSCPFLRALAPPPTSSVPYLESSQLFFKDWLLLQQKTLGGNKLVRATGAFSQVFVGDPESVRYLLAKEHELTTVGWMPSVEATLGKYSLSSVKGDRHRYLRRVLSPAFTSEQLVHYLQPMKALITSYFGRWTAVDGPVDMSREVKVLTFDVIATVMLGLKLDEEELRKLSDLFKVWLGGLFSPLAVEIPFTPFAKAMEARRKLVTHLQRQIDMARGELQHCCPESCPHGMLPAMITLRDDEGRAMEDHVIMDMMFTLLFAGHDTSAATLAGLLYVLTKHPEVVEKLGEEHAMLATTYREGITPQSLRAMKYTEAVLYEFLRLYPIVVGVPRKSLKDFEINGHQIRQGELLHMALGHMGVTDERWAQQRGNLALDVFNPDRFLSFDVNKHPGAQMPFGSGPRICLGKPLALMEMKVFFAVLMRGYRMEYVGSPDLGWNTFPIRRPDGVLSMEVTRA